MLLQNSLQTRHPCLSLRSVGSWVAKIYNERSKELMVEHEQSLGKYYLRKHYSLQFSGFKIIHACQMFLRVLSVAFSSGFHNSVCSRCKRYLLGYAAELFTFSLHTRYLRIFIYLINLMRILYVYISHNKLVPTTYRKLSLPNPSSSSGNWVHRTFLPWMSLKI